MSMVIWFPCSGLSAEASYPIHVRFAALHIPSDEVLKSLALGTGPRRWQWSSWISPRRLLWRSAAHLSSALHSSARLLRSTMVMQAFSKTVALLQPFVSLHSKLQWECTDGICTWQQVLNSADLIVDLGSASLRNFVVVLVVTLRTLPGPLLVEANSWTHLLEYITSSSSLYILRRRFERRDGN